MSEHLITDNTLKVVVSNRFSLDSIVAHKWFSNQLIFLKPYLIFMALLYIGSILPIIQQPGHVVSGKDFVPTSAMVTLTTGYLLNAAYDLLRKWGSKTRVIVKK